MDSAGCRVARAEIRDQNELKDIERDLFLLEADLFLSHKKRKNCALFGIWLQEFTTHMEMINLKKGPECNALNLTHCSGTYGEH